MGANQSQYEEQKQEAKQPTVQDPNKSNRPTIQKRDFDAERQQQSGGFFCGTGRADRNINRKKVSGKSFKTNSFSDKNKTAVIADYEELVSAGKKRQQQRDEAQAAERETKMTQGVRP